MDTQDHTPDEGSAYSTAAQVASESTVPREELLYPADQPNLDGVELNSSQSKLPNEKLDRDQPIAEKPGASEYQLRMPEGVQLDQDLLTSAVPVFQELGLSSDQASKLVPLVTQVQERFLESQVGQLSALSKSWAKEAQADREIGGKNWGETMRLSGVALKAGGASVADAQQLLNESGLGNHPAMIRMFRNIGATIERFGGNKESGTVRESSWHRANRLHQEAVYPNDPPRAELQMRLRGAARSRTETSYPNDLPKR